MFTDANGLVTGSGSACGTGGADGDGYAEFTQVGDNQQNVSTTPFLFANGLMASSTVLFDSATVTDSLYVGGKLDITDDANFSGDILLLGGTQNYLFTYDTAYSGELILQSQSAGTNMFLNLFTEDGDGTDNMGINLYNVGSITDATDYERLSIGWQSGNSQYVIGSIKAGTGTLRPIVIRSDNATNQLYLDTTGDIGINTTTPESLLTVDGTFAVGTDGTEFIVDANGNATTTGSMDAATFCIGGADCITAWPTGNGAYLLNQWLDTTNTPTFAGLNATTTNTDVLQVYDTGTFNWLSATSSLDYWLNSSTTRPTTDYIWDISDNTNLTVTAPITLTDDDLDCAVANTTTAGCISTESWAWFGGKVDVETDPIWLADPIYTDHRFSVLNATTTVTDNIVGFFGTACGNTNEFATDISDTGTFSCTAVDTTGDWTGTLDSENGADFH